MDFGRITDEAPAALRRARDFSPAARQWTLLWLSGLVNRRNGRLKYAIRNFRQIVSGGFEQAKGRGFDFAKDWRLLNELGGALYDLARRERGKARLGGRVVIPVDPFREWLRDRAQREPSAIDRAVNDVLDSLGGD